MKSLHVVLAAPRGPDVDPSDAAIAIAVEARAGGDAAWRAAGLDESRVAALAASGAGRRPPPEATAAVIDVLRATSTLTVALANGAAAVLPARTVAEALALRARHPAALLCGERGGEVVPGFDLGNSPFEYGRERVAGKTLIFASTNGSQALGLAAGAKRRLLAAFLNASAAVERLAPAAEVWLVASGKLGTPAVEDVACAGWIARALVARGFAPRGEEAGVALAIAPRDADGVRALVEGCTHGRLLGEIGPAFVRDVRFCATLDEVREAYEV